MNKWSAVTEFLDGLEDGYNKQDDKIRRKDATFTTYDQLKEGVASGSVEGSFNPVRWIFSILK